MEDGLTRNVRGEPLPWEEEKKNFWGETPRGKKSFPEILEGMARLGKEAAEREKKEQELVKAAEKIFAQPFPMLGDADTDNSTLPS